MSLTKEDLHQKLKEYASLPITTINFENCDGVFTLPISGEQIVYLTNTSPMILKPDHVVAGNAQFKITLPAKRTNIEHAGKSLHVEPRRPLGAYAGGGCYIGLFGLLCRLRGAESSMRRLLAAAYDLIKIFGSSTATQPDGGDLTKRAGYLTFDAGNKAQNLINAMSDGFASVGEDPNFEHLSQAAQNAVRNVVQRFPALVEFQNWIQSIRYLIVQDWTSNQALTAKQLLAGLCRSPAAEPILSLATQYDSIILLDLKSEDWSKARFKTKTPRKPERPATYLIISEMGVPEETFKKFAQDLDGGKGDISVMLLSEPEYEYATWLTSSQAEAIKEARLPFVRTVIRDGALAFNWCG